MASGASAADVRSILSLPAAGPSSGPSQRQTPALPGTKPRRSKPEGISRELYALIGPSAPSLSAQIAKPKFKQKPNLGGGGKAVKWCVRLVTVVSLKRLVLRIGVLLGNGGNSRTWLGEIR